MKQVIIINSDTAEVCYSTLFIDLHSLNAAMNTIIIQDIGEHVKKKTPLDCSVQHKMGKRVKK